MRARKPCCRLRVRFEAWYVRFMTFGSGVRRLLFCQSGPPQDGLVRRRARTGYGKRRESVVNRTAKNGVLESWSGENPNAENSPAF